MWTAPLADFEEVQLPETSHDAAHAEENRQAKKTNRDSTMFKLQRLNTPLSLLRVLFAPMTNH
jgi:hypothetical protein